MAYNKTLWNDNVTPLSAQNMNHIEQGIADAHANLDAHAAAAAAGTHGSATGATANTLAHRDTNGDLTARVLCSTVAAGTAPLSVVSNTVVPSLNADLLDGKHASDLGSIKGTFSIAPYISGGSTYTHTISLGRSASHGLVVLRNTDIGRYGIIAVFTTSAADARGIMCWRDSSLKDYTYFYGGTSWEPAPYDCLGHYGTLNSIYISGSTLYIVFRNADSAWHTINVEGTWEVW